MRDVQTDVVGGLQAQAEAWVKAEVDAKEADSRLLELQNERARIRSRQEDAAKRLAERVGANQPTKVFIVEGFALIVEHERGIHLARVEAKDR